MFLPKLFKEKFKSLSLMWWSADLLAGVKEQPKLHVRPHTQYTSFHKSDNLWYNTLVHWADWTNDSLTKCLTFLSSFFSFIDLGASKLFTFIFVIFCEKNKKINWKRFCKEFCMILLMKKNDCNFRHLFNKSSIPSA